MRRRELTFEERATWGKCPICEAPDGEKCHPEVGFSLGQTIDGRRPQEGAHLGRLQNAPFEVETVAVR